MSIIQEQLSRLQVNITCCITYVTVFCCDNKKIFRDRRWYLCVLNTYHYIDDTIFWLNAVCKLYFKNKLWSFEILMSLRAGIWCLKPYFVLTSSPLSSLTLMVLWRELKKIVIKRILFGLTSNLLGTNNAPQTIWFLL